MVTDNTTPLPRSARDRETAGFRADDWLGDDAPIDWFLDMSWQRQDGAGSRSALRRGGPVTTEGVRAPRGGLAPVYLRRRLTGVAAVVVLVGGLVALLLGVLAGSSQSIRPSASPDTATAPPSKVVDSSTAREARLSVHATATLRIVLSPSGTIRLGDTGSAVRTLQRALAMLGFDPLKADGVFGPVTAQAVATFQRAHALVTDGIVGPKTAASIDAALARPGRG